jgi:hypothetical protein
MIRLLFISGSKITTIEGWVLSIDFSGSIYGSLKTIILIEMVT